MLYKIRKLLFGSNLIRAIKNEDSFIHKILNFGYEKYTDLIIVPYETVCRFLYWGWKLRKNYSFDCSHNTYYILYLKFKGLIDYSRKYGHLLWNTNENGRGFRRLKIACYLAKRLYNDEYWTNRNIHDKKWNIPVDDWLFTPTSYDKKGKILTNVIKWKSDQGLTEIQLKQKRKEHSFAHDLDTKQRDNEKKYLFYLLNKYMEGWWD